MHATRGMPVFIKPTILESFTTDLPLSWKKNIVTDHRISVMLNKQCDSPQIVSYAEHTKWIITEC